MRSTNLLGLIGTLLLVLLSRCGRWHLRRVRIELDQATLLLQWCLNGQVLRCDRTRVNFI